MIYASVKVLSRLRHHLNWQAISLIQEKGIILIPVHGKLSNATINSADAYS